MPPENILSSTQFSWALTLSIFLWLSYKNYLLTNLLNFSYSSFSSSHSFFPYFFLLPRILSKTVFYLFWISLFLKIFLYCSFHLRPPTSRPQHNFGTPLLWNPWISSPLNCLKWCVYGVIIFLFTLSPTKSTQIDFLPHTQKIVYGNLEGDGNGEMGCDGPQRDLSGILNSNCKCKIGLPVYCEIYLCRLI